MTEIAQQKKNLIIDLASIKKRLLIQDPYYGLFISTLEVTERPDIYLAAVTVNKATMEFGLCINPDAWFKLSDEVKFGLLKHEALHLTYFHLVNSDAYPNRKMDNVATDCEINQYIDDQYLPEDGIYIKNLKEEYPKLDWKKTAGRHHYYKELSKLSDEEQEKKQVSDKDKHVWIITEGEGDNKTETTPDQLNESEKEAIRIQVESTMESIAEEVRKSQGNVPAEIDQMISGFKKPKPAFNYKKYIRNFVGNSDKFFIKTSRVRENIRFPGSPKTVLRPRNKMLVLIDQSGSVNKEELNEFLNEIAHLSRNTDTEIRPFDMSVGKVTPYRAGSNEFKRTYCGGTSFTAAIDFYNESRYETCLIFTDGRAETPPPCYKTLLWIISSNGRPDAIKNHAKWLKIPQHMN